MKETLPGFTKPESLPRERALRDALFAVVFAILRRRNFAREYSRKGLNAERFTLR